MKNRDQTSLQGRWRNCISGLAVIAGSLMACLSIGCASTNPGHQAGSFKAAQPDRPLIFVPGILGSKLVHKDSGESAWGGGFDVFFPRDDGYELALPIPSAANKGRLREVGSELVPTTVVDEVRLGPYRRPVYARLAGYFESRGYQVGDLGDPKPGDDFFLFAYDYRLSNLEAVARLRTALDHLRRVSGQKELEFDLLCQSNGGYICRYLVRYGAEFDPVYTGENVAPTRVGPPAGLVPRRLALAGTANAGGLRILRELRDGRYFVRRIGRHMTPEILFAMRPLFDDLPWPEMTFEDVSTGASVDLGEAVFLDETGNPMDVDLYSTEDWVRYGLSVFSGKAKDRLERPSARPLYGDHEDRVRYLGQRLAAARELQKRLLAEDEYPQDLELLMVQGREEATPIRAVLIREGEGDGGNEQETEEQDRGWMTIFSTDPEAEQLPEDVRAKLSNPGDGHASLTSQEMLSPSEKAWLTGSTIYATGTHFTLILDPLALENLASFFLSPPPPDWKPSGAKALEQVIQ